jgi:elongation factor 1-gamma
MAPLTLYTYPGNFRAFKILIAAEYNALEIDVPPFEMLKDNKTPEFLAKSPLGKVPVLDTPAGSIFESNAIARYVARVRRDTELYGATFFESALIDSWIDFCTHELELPATMWLYPVIGYMPYNPNATDKSKLDVARALATLDAHLLTKTFLVGEQMSLADITVASALVYPMKLLMDAKFRKPYPNVCRWFDTCVNQPEFKAVIGDVALCAKELLPTSAPIAGGGGKKEKKAKGGDKAKGQQAKKEKKPAAAPAAETPKEEKKPAEAFMKRLDKSAPSPMDGDEWKRMYSNARDYDALMTKFWDYFDADGWSLWKMDFNYNEENKVAFQVCNATGGFIQRSGEIRKWAFGCVWVLGKDAPFTIEGVWLIRGKSMQPLLDCNPDAEYYTFKQLDHTSEKDKELVKAYWCSEDDVQGVPVQDYKAFK